MRLGDHLQQVIKRVEVFTIKYRRTGRTPREGASSRRDRAVGARRGQGKAISDCIADFCDNMHVKFEGPGVKVGRRDYRGFADFLGRCRMSKDGICTRIHTAPSYFGPRATGKRGKRVENFQTQRWDYPRCSQIGRVFYNALCPCTSRKRTVTDYIDR